MLLVTPAVAMVGLFVLFPLGFAVYISLTADVHHLTFGNYSGLIQGGILHYVRNSLMVACDDRPANGHHGDDGQPTGSPGSFRGSGIVFALVLATLMVPFQALLTPLFLEMHTLGLTNNLIGLALFYTTFNLPFGVFVMRNTFLQTPWELSEAGRGGRRVG